MMKRFLVSVLLLILISGCGYTVGSVLPPGIEKVFVKNIQNKIDITEERTEKDPYILYSPGLEVDVTQAIKSRFIFDGNLKVVNDPSEADLMVTGELTGLYKEPISYLTDDEVDSYRVKVIVDMKVMNLNNNTVYWKREGVVGEEEYITSGPYATSERTARDEAIKDLAKRVVERTVEGW